MRVVTGERWGRGVLRRVGATALAVGSVGAFMVGPARASVAQANAAHTSLAHTVLAHTDSVRAGLVRGPAGHARSGSPAARSSLWSPGGAPPGSGARHTSGRLWRPATLTRPSIPGHPGRPDASGGSWRVQPTPNPAGLANGDLTAESCGGAHACAAVGDYVNDHGTVVPLAEEWNGSGWAIQATPAPRGATSTQLNGVSCPSARSCVAAGFYTDAAGVIVPLAEAWNGSGWAIQATPVPPGAASSGFFGIACGAPGACTAAGDYVGSGGTSATLAERWNGSRWAIQVTPNPVGATNSALFGIACARATCTATGAWSRSSGTTVTLAERWNGSTWAVQATPNPAGADISELDGVSCSVPASSVPASAGASVCVAAGYHQSASGVTTTLAERWNGSTWTRQSTPTPSGATGSGLSMVSCPAANACTAVGGYNTSDGDTLTLAERWNGSRWAIQATANPTGTTASELSAVSCPVLASDGTSACVAAGASKGGSGNPLPLAEGWNGTTWALQATANPAGARESELDGVSCRAVNACEAVGDSTGATLVTRTLAEAWNGTKWIIQRTPNPAKSAGSVLDGVSCPALGPTRPAPTTHLSTRLAPTRAGGCMAVGFYSTGAGAPVPLAETWGGTKWTLQPVPAPAGAQQAWLYSVSCGSPRACLAVGTYTSAGGQTGYAERWNGSTWTLQTVPAPADSGGTALQSVSCTAANACEVGGSYNTSAGAPAPLAEAWNGSTWTLQTVPLPSGSQGGSFEGMSCTVPAVTGPSDCTGTGTYYGNPGGAFAEGWNGKTWRFETAPNPPNGGSSSGDIVLGSVFCVTPRHCFAVGNYNPGNTTASFAEGWNGKTWTLQPLALPPGTGGTRLNGVACAGTRCAAVGDYFGTANLSVTLAESRSVG